MSGLLSHLLEDEHKKRLVWAKGRTIPGWPRDEWCWDDNGKPIRYSHHGNRLSPHGWEMDHYPVPKSLGGSDDVSNLRPLRCRENASHGGLLAAALLRR